MKVCYVAGPYRSTTEAGVQRNIEAARDVAIQLWQAGFSVICPHLNTAFMGGIVPDETFLAGDLGILKRCDLVVTVGEWWDSAGAIGEERFARANGIPVRHCVRDAELWLKEQGGS